MTDRFHVQAGIAVVSAVPASDEIQAIELPGGRTASTLYLGPYEGVGAAWDAIDTWCDQQGIEERMGGWDVYENDPTEVTDPSEIRTRIYLPLS